jgi:membrane associated rhomboid family serine protease
VERLLARLERKFGPYAPGNLTYGLLVAQIIGLLMFYVAPDKFQYLPFDFDRVMAGEVWRVATWLAIPASTSPLWALFAFYWLYLVGTALEGEWGAFKYLVYFVFGALGTVVAASVAHVPASNNTFLLTLFLAFATLWPDFEIRVMFLIPVRVKWLALLAGLGLVYSVFTAPGLERLVPVAGVANYLLFFHQSLGQLVRSFARQAERAGARNRMRAAQTAAELPKVRRCAICGASNENPEVDIRVCNCAKCGGVRRDLCLEHARSH